MVMKENAISRELYQFLAAYFHQDWDLEADDWQGIVDNYVDAVATPAPLLRLAEQIDELRTSRPEPQLDEFLFRQVGVDYSPAPLTYGEWLEQIASRLRLRVSQSGPGATPAGD
ncbi:contact-dependent growth inhibition system immunity protein [Mycolicibacterium vaccae]|uniref:contact-dependent growth inhibition system immunity protein n=1 Tax=Mycolicibacterium vaccae TaxID=1810 RepID=UPI003CFC0FB8